jgi:hypothetical protein
MGAGFIAVIVAVIGAILLVSAGHWLDHFVLKCQSPLRLGVALALMGIGGWLIIVIHTAFWLRVPWAYGPVQFWDDAPGEAFMAVRDLALFLVLAGFALATALVVATAISLFRRSPVPRWRRLVVPAVALGVFAFAYYTFITYQFYPSA